MEFGNWFTHYVLGKKNVVLSVRWNTNSLWHKVAAKLINFTNGDLRKSSTGGNALIGTMIQTF